MRIALIVSRYHAFVTERLESGARAALADAGYDEDVVDTLEVPGAYELAQAAQRAAETGRWSTVVCLGCLIRGETPHFEYIAQAAAHGINRAAQETGVPVTFGLLTTHTAEEALARAAEGPANKGREAALAGLEMARLYARLDDGDLDEAADDVRPPSDPNDGRPSNDRNDGRPPAGRS
jgi:6,7-dimethyl-8-ribityllumazine synthase